ncbi:MAG: macro domain-containing protein [Calditrichaceae bacterium]|nr:macro domain-containing protein [Calditrichaceae bacterium]HES59676.1 macro domain-containing protein [Caldithrix sp.]
MNDSRKINQGVIYLKLGDITQMKVDAIVNAANDRLILGGGVAGSIARAGGPAIQEECYRIGGTFVGGAVITGAGNLLAKYVIHAVGPRMGEGNEDVKLQNAVINSLKVAEENNVTSIAFPAISTGIFGYPVNRCAGIMLRLCVDYLQKGGKIKDIYFCLWGQSTFDIFAETLNELS